MLLCSECVMRRRIAAFQRDDAEPPWPAASSALAKAPSDGLPPVFEAQLVFNGLSLCPAHLVECVQLQRQSGLSDVNGIPLAVPNGRPR